MVALKVFLCAGCKPNARTRFAMVRLFHWARCRNSITNTRWTEFQYILYCAKTLGPTDEQRREMVSIMDGYFRKCHHLNVNVLNRLKCSKMPWEHPEEYPQLDYPRVGLCGEFLFVLHVHSNRSDCTKLPMKQCNDAFTNKTIKLSRSNRLCIFQLVTSAYHKWLNCIWLNRSAPFDGPGVRMVLLHRAAISNGYCANPDTIDLNGEARLFELRRINEPARSQRPFSRKRGGITVSGGEPLCRPKPLIPFCMLKRRRF